MNIRSVDDILEAAKTADKKWKLSVASPSDENTLEAVSQACKYGFAEAVLFGNINKIAETAAKISDQPHTMYHMLSGIQCISENIKALTIRFVNNASGATVSIFCGVFG
jgi:hypothetical protein